MVKVQSKRRDENKVQLYVTIPKAKADRWNLKKGDNVDWNFNERGNLELSKM